MIFSGFLRFLRKFASHRYLIWSMAKREIAAQYVGSFLGFVWTFIKPIVTICIFWFVFSIGFKSRPMGDVPFVVWLAAGLAPWFCFADIVTSSTSTIVSNARLIKKTQFPPEILPVIKLISGLITHMVFIIILLALMLFQGVAPTIYIVQFLYYLFCFATLALGVSWLVSSLNVFIRDVGQVITLLLQVGFWGTPIFWDINMFSAGIQKWLKLNPFFYIVQGYRDSFIGGVPFWHHSVYTLYFWAITGSMLLGGAYMFRKLRPQFSDVL